MLPIGAEAAVGSAGTRIPIRFGCKKQIVAFLKAVFLIHSEQIVRILLLQNVGRNIKVAKAVVDASFVLHDDRKGVSFGEFMSEIDKDDLAPALER